jgi:hypothetical protein
MRTKQAGVLTIGMIMTVVGISLLPGCTFEQILIGQQYRIYTPPMAACPRLEWRFVVNPQRSIDGSLSGEGQRLATLSGRLDADDSFHITATGAAGNRTADVTGRFTSQVSTISIRGDAAGSACNGQNFDLRLGSYFARQGGGGGGGG